MLDRKFLLGTTVIAGLAAAALVAPTMALAQTAPVAKPPATIPAPAADDEENKDGDVSSLVVTGSRIKRNEFSSPAPITVITSEQASLRGLADTAEILQQSSVASGSFQVNNNLTGFVVDGGPGVNTISLRGLGANRTLVLLNGKRLGPAGVRGTVGPIDLNVIPSSIIDRVEILKDGASSIYGSDAVAGVVNFITKKNIDGGEVNVFARGAFDQGGEFFRISGTYGKTFDRGYANVGVDYQELKELTRGDRDETKCSSDYLFSGATGAPVDFLGLDGKTKCYNLPQNYLTVARKDGTGSYGGAFQYPVSGVTYPSAAQGNNVAALPAVYQQFVRASRTGFFATFPYFNTETKLADRRSVFSPVKRTSLTFNGGFDITPNAEAYVEFLYNNRDSAQNSARQLFPDVAPGNPNNPFTTNAGDTVCTALQQCKFTPVIGVAYDFTQNIDYYRVVAGVRGTFGNWDYDLYTQISRSDGEYTGDVIYNDRVLAVTGATACNQALITKSGNLPGASCAALPGGIPFASSRILSGDFNAAERAFLFGKETGTTTYDQALVEGTISGDVFTLPAGPVGVAVGFQLRHEKIDDQPGQTAANYNIWGLTSAGPTKGDDTIKEIFVETNVPVLKGLPGVESFDLSLSGRYTDYDSYGSNSTYKIGANWQIVPAVRLRATYGTSFRAPSLYELNLGGQTGFLGQTSIDPCIHYELSTNTTIQNNCAAAGIAPGFTGGNAGSALIQTFGGSNLKAETSKAYTLGVIWSPTFIDLQVAVDYFNIKVDDEVTRFGAGNILEQCYKSTNPATNPFCTLFTRDGVATNFGISYVNDSYINIAKQINRGIDLTYRYAHEFDFGRLVLDGQFTWQLKDVTTLLLGSSTSDYNGTTNLYDGPDFTGQLGARFEHGDWTFSWSTDLIGKGSDTENFGGDTFNSTRYGQAVKYKQYVEFTAFHDISVRKRMDSWTFTGGIANLFDEKAPSVSTGQFRAGTAALNQYGDGIIGRQVFVSVQKRW